MATAKPKIPDRPLRRRVRRMLLWLALAAIAVLAWFWKPLNSYAVTVASSDARVACSCHFISGRSLSECRGDFEPGMGMVVLTEDAGEKSVTAWVPPLSSQTATFRQGQGCVLGNWKDWGLLRSN